jgi:putative transposase
MIPNPCKTILQFIAKDLVEPALLAQNDYLRAENEILLSQVEKLTLNNGQRYRLAELGQRLKELNKSLFEASINIVKPDTLLRWHRKLVAQKFDGSSNRTAPSVKRITKEIEAEIVRIAREDLTAGYSKIVGYLQDLGISFSETAIANILRKHGIDPAPKRKHEQNWKEFIQSHLDLMWGCDFFTHEVWTLQGLATYYVLVFIHLGSRRLEVVNMTQHPTAEWTAQQARNFLYDSDAIAEKGKMRFLLHDKGTQFNEAFHAVFEGTRNEHGEKIETVTVSCPQMNGYTERVIQSIQNECTDRLIFIGERMLRYALKQYQEHYNTERHHQGIGNIIPFPTAEPEVVQVGERKCKTRLGGILRKYYRASAA